MQIDTRIRITTLPVELGLQGGIDIHHYSSTKVIVLIKRSPVILNI